MPGKITKLSNGKYQVVWDGKITAKGTTATKADAQLRMLEALEYKAHPGSVRVAKHKAQMREKGAKRLAKKELVRQTKKSK